jgi:membrane protease subunit (stomatin/prohibitin family)
VNGELHATLPAGLTQLSSLYQLNSPGRVEVVFSKVRVGKFRWGQGDLTTSDGITIGAHGTVAIQENDPVRFIHQLPQGQPHLSINDLKDLVLREIRSVLKKLISMGSVSDLQKDLRKYEETIALEVRSRLNELGIGISAFEILSFNLPQEYLGAVQKRAVRALETQAETSRLEQFKKVGVDVTKFATVEAAVGKANPVQVVTGDYVAGPSIRDSVLVRSNVGGDDKAEDTVVTGGFTASCPVCNTTLSPSKHKFCFECGARVRVCPQCRIAIPSHGKFCSQCGNPLPADP